MSAARRKMKMVDCNGHLKDMFDMRFGPISGMGGIPQSRGRIYSTCLASLWSLGSQAIIRNSPSSR